MAATLSMVLYFLIFPGLLFTGAVGLLTTWVDRKVSARVQWRVGPPWYQPFADILKLMGKEIVIPEGARRTGFLVAPLAGLAAVGVVSMMLWLINMKGVGFVGDLIGVIYLLTIPSLGMIIGASASSNPLASVGASREMKLVLAYELPFVIAVFTAVTKISPMTLRIDGILDYQAANGVLLGNASCIIAFIVCILCAQAKLTYPPFDIPEAETEIVAGPTTELTGKKLALWNVSKDMLMATGAALVVALFLGGPTLPGLVLDGALGVVVAFDVFFLKVLLILLLLALLKAALGRLRIDQLMDWGWKVLTPAAVIQIGIVLIAKGVGLL